MSNSAERAELERVHGVRKVTKTVGGWVVTVITLDQRETCAAIVKRFGSPWRVKVITELRADDPLAKKFKLFVEAAPRAVGAPRRVAP